MTIGVYMIRHKKSNKIYIGSSQDVEKRFSAHQSDHGVQVVHRAIKKYGADAFEWTILEECELTNLIEREQVYIDLHRPFGERGYNIRRVADRNSGIVLSQETRLKMSVARKGKTKSDDHKRKLSEAGKNRDNSHLAQYRGQPHSEETKKRLSELAMGRTWAHDADRVRNHIALRKGKSLSPEHIEKVRQTHIGSKRTEDSRDRMSEWQQRSYLAVSPEGEEHYVLSRDLNDWLPKHNLNRPNFCKAVTTSRPYKGWTIKKL